VSEFDPYLRLRPSTRGGSCRCPALRGLLLVNMFTRNPLYCEQCRNEVDPERLQLSVREVDSVADWVRVAHALQMLWLDSGEYERYAKARMLDINGQVNQKGLALAGLLSARVPTRLWFWHDPADGEPTLCPQCQRQLDKNVEWGTARCPVCPMHL